MTSTTRREALSVLTELSNLAPDVRLGQLLAHLGFLGEDETGRTLWDIDDELLAVLKRHRDELLDRSADPQCGVIDLSDSSNPATGTWDVSAPGRK